MNYVQRSVAPLARYFFCAAVAILAAGCNGGGAVSSGTLGSSTSASQQNAPAPSITGTPDAAAVAGSPYSFQPSVSDTNGDALTFSVENLPSWATFDMNSGGLSGTPSDNDVGSFQSIIISVSNGKASAQLTPFSIQVTAAPTKPKPPTNSPPTIMGTPATSVQAGSHYAFQPSAADADKDPLVFAISGQPSWTSFNTTTGQLSGTPANADVGTYSNIVISVSDGKATTSLLAFQITVTAIPPAPPTNNPPKITGTPSTSIQAGTAYSFQPTATDADGNTLTFSITNKPSWATFSTTTGRLMGTPATANVGAYSNIIISVSDGTVSVSLPSFSIQVTAPPPVIPPTISGTPSTHAQVGTAYSFTPTASDPSGKTLSFSVQNKPSWATFSTTTGQLSGTPTSTDVGTNSNIIISVSDGSASAALTAFSIIVAAAPVIGTATVQWIAPTQNTDGSTLTNLSGYVLWYGTNSSSLSQSVTITDSAATSYTVQNLAQGTWYFAVTATAGGTQSALSTVVSKTIQ